MLCSKKSEIRGDSRVEKVVGGRGEFREPEGHKLSVKKRLHNFPQVTKLACEVSRDIKGTFRGGNKTLWVFFFLTNISKSRAPHLQKL